MKTLIVLTLLLLSPLMVLAAPQTEQSLPASINTILKTFGDDIHIGILIQDQKTGKTLYAKNASHYFMPASNEKLLTAYSALEYLGENFTYHTQLFADTSKIHNGILNDNIYLQFSGDPSLTIAELDNLIHSLKMAGINQINGSIVIDDFAFDQESMSVGTTWDDKDFCWGAPINAIIVQENCVMTTIKPSAQVNTLAEMTLPDAPQSMQFVNTALTGSDAAENCELITKRISPSSYSISGCIKQSAAPKIIAMAIDSPRENLKFILSYLLNKNQIENAHHFKFERTPVLPPLLAQVNSPNVLNLVITMLKESDNVIANALFKTIGSVKAKEAGSFKNGSDAVRDILSHSIQLDIAKTTLIDGAGGSRYNFVTPQQLVLLLQKSAFSPHGTNFIAALPVGGVDGTLKSRMKNSAAERVVFAKTGTETAVSTLSGYLETHKKHTLVFSIMINGFVDLPSKYEKLEDQLCAAMVENG